MDVFVYGTLTEPDRVASVLDSFVFVGAAVLEGCPRFRPLSDARTRR
jgi:hypothetical protein